MHVRAGHADLGNLRHRRQRRLAHPVEAVLHALAVGHRKHFQHGVEDLLVGRGIARGLARPVPRCHHAGRAHPVRGRRDRGVGIPDVILPAGLRRFHERKAVDAGRHRRRAATDRRHFHGGFAVAVEHETMRMRRAAKTEPAPFGLMHRERDGGDLRIGVEIFLRQHLAEFFRAQAGILAGNDVDDVLDGVGRHRGGVVTVGIGPGKVAFDHRLDVELADLLAVAVAMDPHHADAAFPVSVFDQRHVGASSSASNFAGLWSPGVIQ